MSKLAVQMWTLRNEIKTASEMASSLEKIADIGYPAVQFNGDHPELNAQELRKLLDMTGLRCVATHRGFDSFQKDIQAEIAFHETLGCDYTALGSLGRDYAASLEGYRKFVADATPVIEKLKAAGIRFGYHNHAHEFYRPERHGLTLMDVLIDEAPQKLMMELDLYWVDHAGLNCERTVERCSGRVPIIHLKDKEVDVNDGPRMAPIGEGNMDWDHIIPTCETAGVDWYLVEQDNCYRDPFDCLKSSFEYLTSKGL